MPNLIKKASPISRLSLDKKPKKQYLTINQTLKSEELKPDDLVKADRLNTRTLIKKMNLVLNLVKENKIKNIKDLAIAFGIYTDKYLLLRGIINPQDQPDIAKLELTIQNVSKLIALAEKSKPFPEEKTEGVVVPPNRIAQFQAETGQGEEIKAKEVMPDVQDEKIEPE